MKSRFLLCVAATAALSMSGWTQAPSAPEDQNPVVLDWTPPALASLSAQAVVKNSFTLDRNMLNAAASTWPDTDEPTRQAINRLEGVVTDVGYLGGLTTYKVRLDTGAVVRSSMANTARLDRDAYHASQRVVAWFSPDDCVVLEQ